MSLRERTSWMPRRGVSIDALAVGRLREFRQREGPDSLAALRKQYDAVVRQVGSLPDGDAQAVLLAAASDYSLELLWDKAARPQTIATSREKRIAAYVSDLSAAGMGEDAARSLAEKHFPPRKPRQPANA